MFGFARNVFCWAGKKYGPRHGCLVMMDGSLVHVDYSTFEAAYKVVKEVPCEKVAGLLEQVPKDGTWTGTYVREAGHSFNKYLQGRIGETLEQVAARLLREKKASEDEEMAILADPVRDLEREIKGRDWYSHMADDHGSWAAGEAQDKRIKALIEKVPAEKVREFWDRYAPKGCKYPV